MATENINFAVTANQSSAGDFLPIDSDTLAGCTVTNGSAVAVEYSTGGAWTTIAAGASATVNTGAIATTSLRFRKKTGDSYPVYIGVSVVHPGVVPAQIATDAGGNVIGFAGSVCFRDNAAHASTVTGADETLLSVTIPAAALRADSIIRITSLWSCTNSANAKTFKIQADGQNVLNLSQTTVASFHDMHIIRFRSLASQVVNNAATATPFGTTASTGVNTLTVDATDGLTLTFLINRTNAGDSAALESAIVEVL